MSVRTTVKAIQDIMRQDSGVDGDAQRISQLCWMFFLKIIDDQDQELELLDREYRSPIPKKYRWRTWAADPEGITGEELYLLALLSLDHSSNSNQMDQVSLFCLTAVQECQHGG